MSRNDHGSLSCASICPELHEQSTGVHSRPALSRPVVTQLVTHAVPQVVLVVERGELDLAGPELPVSVRLAALPTIRLGSMLEISVDADF